MSKHYPKINSLFLRDENNLIMPNHFTSPEFDYLKDCKWECTEKIDGTNIHIDFTLTYQYDENGEPQSVDVDTKICGRTDKANIPAHLYARLQEIFLPTDDAKRLEYHARFNEAFATPINNTIINRQPSLTISIYGEGYGVKIQKAGGRYMKDGADFILFDVKVGEWWLKRGDCENIAKILGLQIVPLMGYYTIPEAIEIVKKGFTSTVSQDPTLEAEGFVLKTPDGLCFRNGQRIITKLKTPDFRKYHAKYGDGPVNQIPNPKYSSKQ